MAERYFFIHVGLPKTATTFMQNSIFKKSLEINYMNRKRVNDYFEKVVGVGLRKIFSLSPLIWNGPGREALIQLIRRFGVSKSLVISDENFSVNADFFSFSGSLHIPDPYIVAAHMKSIDNIARDNGFAGVKVVISIRRQDTWLASRYVQSADKISVFSQEDFERRVNNIFSCNKFAYSKKVWIDYEYLLDVFSWAVGPKNVHFFPMEKLSAHPVEFVGELDSLFCARGSFVDMAKQEDFFAKKSTNSKGSSTWSIMTPAGGEVFIELNEDLRERLISEFRDSNMVFDKRLRLGLSSYGYY